MLPFLREVLYTFTGLVVFAILVLFLIALIGKL